MPKLNGITVNQPQYEAIIHRNGPMLVLAGPGSGKTLVITQRIQYLIEEHQINPSEILVITFTKAAALEMEERFKNMCEGKSYPVTFGTFHSIFFHILKFTYRYTFRNIITSQEKKDILTAVAHAHMIEEEITQDLIELLLSEISHQKNSGKSIADYQSTVIDPELFHKIQIHYQEETTSRRKLDFDDMVLQCYHLFKSNPVALKIWQDKFPFLLIDEFQDINPIQFRVIQLLAKPNNHLFIVGDDDQSIYGFRGSDPSIMLSFHNIYPTCISILLNVNYRSKEEIVTCATSLICHNQTRFKKAIQVNRKENGRVSICDFPSREAQNLNMVALIMQYMGATMKNSTESILASEPETGVLFPEMKALTQELLLKKNKKVQPKDDNKFIKREYSDIAIISRTKAQEGLLIEKLISAKIPFVVKEKTKNIYHHFIAVDLFAYLKFAHIEPKRSYLYQILNKPNRYLVRKSVEEERVNFQFMERFYQDNWSMIQKVNQLEYDMKMIGNLTPYAAINYIRKGIGYDDYAKSQAQKNNVDYSEYEEVLDDMQIKGKEFDTLEQWLDHICTYETELNKCNRLLHKNIENGVAILTMHGSKGLEFPVVILPNCNEGSIPHSKAITIEEIEEERRVFYVGMTRAKDFLYLFYIDKKKKTSKAISRFLEEIEKK